MYIAGRRLVQLVVVVVVAAAIIAVAAFNYDDVVKYINPPPKTPSTPTPFQPVVSPLHPTETPSMPASLREEVLSIIKNSKMVKEVLGQREFSVSSVLPWISEGGNITGSCAVINFPSPVWLEFNASDLKGRPLEYIGWVKQLTICVDLASKKVVGVKPSISTSDVPGHPPESMSLQARMLVEKVLNIAKKFLQEEYGLKEDGVNLTFYGVLDGVAAVLATPKTGDKLHNVEILIKIDTKSMEVIEAHKYTPHEIYVNPKHVNITRKE